MVHHVALRFAYDGSCFPNGYARQPQGGTVEDALHPALAAEGMVEGSWRTGSRTDRGVSALENVAACAFDRPHLRGLVPAIQQRLPEGLWITGAAPAEPDWNPRHHAMRTYHYLLPSRDESLTAMQAAARVFEGEHDLSAFARVEPHRNPVRTIDTCTVGQEANAWRFTVASPGFLWNQVRRMVDAMAKVGSGALQLDDVVASLETGRIHPGMKMAPAAGLLLHSVRYNPAIAWDETAGALGDQYVAKAWQAARVRSVLLDGLSGSS